MNQIRTLIIGAIFFILISGFSIGITNLSKILTY